MIKILVVSDTHKHINNVIKLMELVKPDRLIHLGDHSSDAQDLESIYTKVPIDYVMGNCDFYEPEVPKDKIITLMGKKIWITHGHLYNVKQSYEYIKKLSAEKNVDAVLFGHTHIPYIGYEGEKIFMNPGSISLPKEGHYPSFGLIEIDEKARIYANVKELKRF